MSNRWLSVGCLVSLSIVLALLSFPPSVHAQADVMGMFAESTDPAGFCSSVQITEPVSIDLYLVVRNPTWFQIQAWELRLQGDGAEQLFGSWDYFGGIQIGDVNDWSDARFIVGTGANPLVPNANNDVILAHFSGFLSGTDPITFRIGPIPGSQSFDPPAPGYAGDENNLFPCTVCSGDFDTPVLAINGSPLGTWEVGLTATFQLSPPIIDHDNVAAVAEDALDGLDAQDVIANDTRVYFDVNGTHLDHDVKALYDPTHAVKEWNIVVHADPDVSSGAPYPVVLDFAPSFSEQSGVPLILWDDEIGQAVDLYQTDPPLSYTFTSPGSGGTRTFSLQIGVPAIPNELSVTIDGSSGQLLDAGNVAGTAYDATDGYDAGIDVPEPPSPPADYVTLYFPHPEWQVPLGPRFQADRRAVFDPTAQRKTWRFRVDTDQSGPVHLAFTPNFGALSGIPLQLRDNETGSVVDLFAHGLAYDYYPSPDGSNTFDLIVGVAGPPPLQPESRELPAGWSLVGVPLTPSGDDTWNGVLLNQAPGFAYLFDDNDSGGYDPLPGATAVQPGQGAWLATDTGFIWTMQGDPAVYGVSVPLRRGWNLVGYPLWIPSDINGVMVDHAGQRYGWSQAAQMGLVSAQALDYDPGTPAYVATTQLETWHGYWIAAYQDGVSLWFDFTNVPEARLVQYDPFTRGDPERNWRVTVQTADGGSRVTFGQTELTSDGFDPRWEMPAAPPAPDAGERPQLYFAHPEWNLPTGAKVTTDLQGADKADLHWDAVLEAPRPGPVTLTWRATSFGPLKDMQIYLPQQNRVVVMSMVRQQSVTLQVGDEPLVVRFREPDMTTGADDLPGAGAALWCSPNPFNPQTVIRYRLPRRGTATVRIYDARGRLVRSLDGGEQAAGVYQVRWQGRDDRGEALASGVYFAALVLDGERTGAVQKLSLVR